jgi:hypothetical protein
VRLYPGCNRALRRGLMTMLIVLGTTLAVGATSAMAGQIVYQHGGDLWVMNDDGTGQRPLATASQIGGPVTTPDGNTSVSVQPGGTGVAFAAGSCPFDTYNCPALYSLLGGKLTRLAPAQTPCSAGDCASFDSNPAVTSDGRVVYEHDWAATSYPCSYYCGGGSGLSEQYMVQNLDGSSAPVAWPLPASNGDSTDPRFSEPIASDPADPSVLAYQGNALPNQSSTYYPLDLEHSSANPPSVTQPATTWDGDIWGLGFSQDASLVADVETDSNGANKGIWVYPANGSYSTDNAYWALEDPDNNDGSALDHYITGVTFVGNGEIVFSANYNLYSLPSRCWATPADSNTTTANCHFPQDVTQLTHDGTSAAPDASPAWTSSTTPIAAFGSTPSSSGPSLGPGPGPSSGPGPEPHPGPSAQVNATITVKSINARKHSATFKFTDSGKTSGFQCALVKQQRKRRGHKQAKPVFSPCASPKVYRHLAHGSYAFYVKASGGSNPAMATFKL